MSPSRVVELARAHRLLGPRTAYLIGTVCETGRGHICTATNVTAVGVDPPMLVLALSPEWTTTQNVVRTGEFTLSLVSLGLQDALWIAGSRYSGVELAPDDDKFVAAGLSPMLSCAVDAPGVREALATLECRVETTVESVSDHVMFVARVLAARCEADAFALDDGLDVAHAQPAMQITGSRFARASPASAANTKRCDAIVRENLRRA